MNYFDLLKLAAPEVIVVATALVVLAIGLAAKTQRIAADASLTAALLGILAAIAVIFQLPQTATLFSGMLAISPLNSLFKNIGLVLTLFAVGLGWAETGLDYRGEYVALLLFAGLGLMLLIGSEELLVIFIGLEILGLSLYILAAYDKYDLRSAEAGLKYFLFGSTASAFTLFGISLVYGTTGTTRLAAIAQALATTASQPLLVAAIIMTLIGFAFKIAAVPFHLWAPDVYQGAPISSAAFIASASKVASFVVLGKIVLLGFAPLHGSSNWHAMVAGWSPVLAILAALSIVLGNFVALVQTNVRRLLAYSAVAHAGYTLLGLVAGGREGFAATLFYTTIYAFTLLGAFGVCAIVRSQTGDDNLADFAGLFEQSPLTAACMAVFMLSLAGLPPLAGFFGKFYLFSAALAAGEERGLLWLVIVALFGSFISLYYYLIVLKAIFVDRPSHAQARRPLTSRQLLPNLTVFVLAHVVVYIGIAPSPLLAQILESLS